MRTVGRKLWWVLVTVFGVAVFTAGLVMLVLPGPGLLCMAAGLAILATEHEWARHHVHRVRQRAYQVSQTAAESTRNLVLSVLFGLGLVVAGVGALLLPQYVPFHASLPVGIGLVIGGTAVTVGTALGYRERRLAVEHTVTPLPHRVVANLETDAA